MESKYSPGLLDYDGYQSCTDDVGNHCIELHQRIDLHSRCFLLFDLYFCFITATPTLVRNMLHQPWSEICNDFLSIDA